MRYIPIQIIFEAEDVQYPVGPSRSVDVNETDISRDAIKHSSKIYKKSHQIRWDVKIYKEIQIGILLGKPYLTDWILNNTMGYFGTKNPGGAILQFSDVIDAARDVMDAVRDVIPVACEALPSKMLLLLWLRSIPCFNATAATREALVTASRECILALLANAHFSNQKCAMIATITVSSCKIAIESTGGIRLLASNECAIQISLNGKSLVDAKIPRSRQVLTLAAQSKESVTKIEPLYAVDSTVLFMRMSVLLERSGNEIENYFRYELTPEPTSLFKENFMRKPNKVALIKANMQE
ncbi:hypothetical protein GQR58_016649 [Nymphon striatum]|nr:hypothetical protein GQR58_016649 [Nymphon striatum]